MPQPRPVPPPVAAAPAVRSTPSRDAADSIIGGSAAAPAVRSTPSRDAADSMVGGSAAAPAVRSTPSRDAADSIIGGSAAAPPGTLRTAEDLAAAGLIAAGETAAARAVAARYAVAVPEALARAIRDDAAGALARQFVPAAEELAIAPDELADPIGDEAHSPVKGVVHRYPDRVLLKPLHACAVYCRFCFRREQVGPGGEALSAAETDAALDYIARHEDIWEVILSGGDPLLLSARRLKTLIGRIARIPHVGVIRVHTRMPVADPARVTGAVVRALKCEKAVYVVLHCNHEAELTEAARAACARLIDAGVPMLAQSVLLKGVNDDETTMERLFRALAAARIKPYYLHHPDLARGTAHFRVPLERGRAVMAALRGRLSGLAQPAYVLDIPGGHGKVPVGPDYLRPGAEAGEWIVTDPAGREHAYFERDVAAAPRRGEGPQNPPAPACLGWGKLLGSGLFRPRPGARPASAKPRKPP